MGRAVGISDFDSVLLHEEGALCFDVRTGSMCKCLFNVDESR